jgi:hypothetical protein
MPATVGQAGGTAAVGFTISPDLFTVPRGKVVLGLDVSAQPGSNVSPRVNAVQDAQGRIHPVVHAVYDPSVQSQLGGKTETSAATVTISAPVRAHGKLVHDAVIVTGTNQSTGSLRLGFYLPGDANGDGVVTQSDIKAIRAAMGAKYGASNYNLSLDANRDGRIDAADVAIARRNLGVRTTVNPVLSGSFNPSVSIDTLHRTTANSDLPLSGSATPGATISLDETQGKTPEVKTTVDASGHYSIDVHLAQGSNAFNLTETDGFGQVVQGVIFPIEYAPKS